MKFFTSIKKKWSALGEKSKPGQKKMKKFGRSLKKVWDKIYKFRDIVLALPVVIGSIWMACMNLAKLPGEVGIDLQANGEFSMTVGKGLAILFPLLITAVCLLLMIISKRKLYPWLISLLTLLLPVLLLITNVYPS